MGKFTPRGLLGPTSGSVPKLSATTSNVDKSSRTTFCTHFIIYLSTGLNKLFLVTQLVEKMLFFFVFSFNLTVTEDFYFLFIIISTNMKKK